MEVRYDSQGWSDHAQDGVYLAIHMIMLEPSKTRIARVSAIHIQHNFIFHQTLTQESLVKLFFRPLGLICLPPVLWAALVESVTIGYVFANLPLRQQLHTC